MTDYETPERVDLDTEFGPVCLSLTSAYTAHATVGTARHPAHINDGHPTLIYRGEEWIGGVHLVKDSSGHWIVDPRHRPRFTSRGPGYRDAPRTWGEKMCEGIIAAMGEWLDGHPDAPVEAQRRALAREVHGLEREEQRLREAYEAAHAKTEAARGQLTAVTR